MAFRVDFTNEYLHVQRAGQPAGAALWAGTVTTDGMDDGEYDATVVLAVDSDRQAHTVERVELRRRPGGAPITAAGLRSTGEVGKVIRSARRMLSAIVPVGESPTLAATLPAFGSGPGFPLELLDLDPTELDQHQRTIAVGARGHGAAGRAFVPDKDLRTAATAYRQALKQREPTTAAVMKALGVSQNVARKRVRRARVAGFLPAVDGKTRPRPADAG